MSERPYARLSRLGQEMLDHPISGLGLSTRAYHCLAQYGTVRALLTADERELMSHRSFGRACLSDVRRTLARYALRQLAVPDDHPMRRTCDEEHPAVQAVWEAPPQPRPLRDILEEILELLSRGDELRATPMHRAVRARRMPIAINFEQATAVELADYVFAPLKRREREALQARYGTEPAAPSLADLAKRFQLSRERVRQVLETALGRVRAEAEQQRRKPLTTWLRARFEAAGGILSEEAVRSALRARYRGPAPLQLALTRVLLTTTHGFKPLGNGVWCLEDAGSDEVRTLLDQLHGLLRQRGTFSGAAELAACEALAGDGVTPALVAGCAAADPRFCVNERAEIGLREWAWGVPASPEEWLRACLLSVGKPQTAAALRQRVNDLLPPGSGLSRREVNGALVRSGRFVRLATGQYSLADWARPTRGDVSAEVQIRASARSSSAAPGE